MQLLPAITSIYNEFSRFKIVHLQEYTRTYSRKKSETNTLSAIVNILDAYRRHVIKINRQNNTQENGKRCSRLLKAIVQESLPMRTLIRIQNNFILEGVWLKGVIRYSSKKGASRREEENTSTFLFLSGKFPNRFSNNKNDADEGKKKKKKNSNVYN